METEFEIEAVPVEGEGGVCQDFGCLKHVYLRITY